MNTSMGEGKQQLPPGNEGSLHEGARYFPQELIGYDNNKPKKVYYFYLIELQPDFEYDVTPQHIELAVGKMLDGDLGDFKFNMEADGGKMIVHVKLFDLLLNRNLDKHQPSRRKRWALFNYLLIPARLSHGKASVDWRCINSVIDSETAASKFDHTKMENSVVLYNDALYRVINTLDGVLHGKRIFTVHNNLQRCPIPPEPSSTYKLQPELCSIVMSPISISTFYSFSFLPTVMHRIESLLIAANLKSILAAGHFMQNVEIPAIKVLEAITTKKCQEELHLNSLKILGDSFLKYAASQQLFKTHQSTNQGFLTLKRQEIVSNAALCKLGRDRKILGFIQNEPFDPKTWMIPGLDCGYGLLEEEQIFFASRKVYTGGSRRIEDKTVADVVKALIGAFLSAAGEKAALSFMMWLGIIEGDFATVPYTRKSVTNPDMHVNIRDLESLLRYSFRDASLLVEALTHSSYMRPEIPGCYQRLEFLGDAVLDYLITVHMYHEYPDLSLGTLTDLRSASTNNDSYARLAIKAGLHKHILRLPATVDKSEETTLPKVLGDVIESLAGAIFVDSRHNTEAVFRSMKPLLEPFVTPDTLKIHPKRELNELCQKENYTMQKPVISWHGGLAHATVGVEARGAVHKETWSAEDRRLPERPACKAVPNSLKESMDEGVDTPVGHGEPGPWLPPRIFLFFFVAIIFVIWCETCSSAYENSE